MVAATPESDARAAERPSMTADLGPLSSHCRAAERAEVLTVAARELRTDAAPPSETEQHVPAACALRRRLAATWCDVVQCRRSSGAQLLRYATPPPARA